MIDFGAVRSAANVGFVIGLFLPIIAFLAEQTHNFQERVTFTENATRLEKVEAWLEWISQEAKTIGLWDFLYVMAIGAVIAAAFAALAVAAADLITVIDG